nr:Toll/interleukin-1 receptor (TIR) domain-containing protein [Tanacetum cinerariifolium]
MASSSSLFKQRYDVFLSFRGFDTRLNFTAYLHDALKIAQIKTFYDDEECETGKPLKPVLEEAIKNSRASLIVISTTYASSTWCLDELVSILKQLRDISHIVFPIFYCVQPTDVRSQKESFSVSMEEHKQKMEAETDVQKKSEWAQKIEKWKDALTEVANLKGHTYEYDAKTIGSILSGLAHQRLFSIELSAGMLLSGLADASGHFVLNGNHSG